MAIDHVGVEVSFPERLTINADQKQRIAAAAAKRVRDNSVILIDNGSSVYLMADYLSEKKNLTIITFFLPLVNKLSVRSDWKILWGKGYGMVSLNLFPVRYEPAAGTVYYTRRLTVRVRTRPEAAPQDVMPCRGLPGDRLWIEGMVQNPALAVGYGAAAVPGGATGTGGSGGPMGPGGTPPDPELSKGARRPYVIITNQALADDPGPDNFQDLLAHRAARGLPGMIVTVEEIYQEFPGLDDQEKIRNFCRHAYQEWGTEYVLLGGDGSDVGAGRIVPARGMWATAEGYMEKNLKSDLYYACLDGSFNEDGDSKWGERTDGPGGGDVDRAPEVFVGRAPVSTAALATAAGTLRKTRLSNTLGMICSSMSSSSAIHSAIAREAASFISSLISLAWTSRAPRNIPGKHKTLLI